MIVLGIDTTGILGGIVTLIVGAVVALVKAFSNGDG